MLCGFTDKIFEVYCFIGFTDKIFDFVTVTLYIPYILFFKSAKNF